MTLVLCLLLALAPSQDETTADPDGLQASRQAVEVESPTDDARIERRLQQILETTGRFDGVELEVRHGVVLLRGVVSEQPERAWIIDLVSNTEGVAAVSSEVTIEEAPIWNMDPAIRELEQLWRSFVRSLPRLAAGLGVLLLVLLTANRAARLVSKPLERRFGSELLRTVIGKAITVAVWMLGLYLFLRVSGLTRIAMTVVGGTGVLGIVLGFAFRDIAENFLASVLISLQRPFRYGDTIEVDGHQGVVQRVTPRGTILMDFDGNYIQIANAQVYKSTIKNYSANPNVRQTFVVGVGYDAAVSHAQDVVMNTLTEHSAVLDDPKPMVLVEEFASSTINLVVYFWVDGSRHSKVKVRSALMRMTLRALEKEGVSMPDDAREMLFPNGVPVTLIEPGTPPPHASNEEDAGAEDPRQEDDLADEVTSAEGDLESETEELNEQARRSRPPEEGEDVLAR